MKKLLNYCMLIMVVALMASCSTERRAISQMRTLTTHIERDGNNYSVDDWVEAYQEFREIDSSIDQSKLSPAQRNEYTALQARCIKSFAKSSVSTVKEGIANYIKEGVSIVKEIIDAILE